MKRLLHHAAVVGGQPGPVLVQGETGTGKSVVCDWIHRHSSRAEKPIFRKSCGEFDEGTFEAALFGHTADAYTSARTVQPGILLHADQGTLVLDDVDCLAAPFQGRLLRFLDDGRISPLGEPTRQIPCDVRIIATTNRDLAQMASSGGFRHDLWYRLRRWLIRVPALRSRPEDVAALSVLFEAEFQEKQALPELRRRHLSPPVIELFQRLRWHGNIRQLRAAVENVLLFGEATRDGTVGLRAAARILFDDTHAPCGALFAMPWDPSDDAFLHAILEVTGWNIQLTSDIVGCSRGTVYARIRRNGWRQP